jgi:hypothetical protein
MQGAPDRMAFMHRLDEKAASRDVMLAATAPDG